MPKVKLKSGTKTFPYTMKGKKAAAKMAKKTGGKLQYGKRY